MNRPTGSLLLVLCLIPLLAQCVASEQELKGVDLRLRTMDNRMVNIERDVGELKNEAGKGTVEKIRKQQAAVDNTTDRLKTELLQIKGQLEETSHINRKQQEEDTRLREEVHSRYTELTEKTDQLAERLDAMTVKLDTITAELETIKAARTREAAERALAAARAAQKAKEMAEQSAAPREIVPEQTKKKIKEDDKKPEPSAPAVALDPEKALYDRGLSFFKEKRYKEAYNTFSEYIDTYPKGTMSANARFWQGDCLFKQNEFELAILEYQKVIADFPNHRKAPAALLKQGMAFEKLNDNETAKIVYRKLVNEYPKSEQLPIAKNRLESLK